MVSFPNLKCNVLNYSINVTFSLRIYLKNSSQSDTLQVKSPLLVKHHIFWYNLGFPNPPIGNQVKHLLLIFSIFLFSLTIISCAKKSSDDSKTTTDDTTTSDDDTTTTTTTSETTVAGVIYRSISVKKKNNNLNFDNAQFGNVKFQ